MMTGERARQILERVCEEYGVRLCGFEVSTDGASNKVKWMRLAGTPDQIAFYTGPALQELPEHLFEELFSKLLLRILYHEEFEFSGELEAWLKKRREQPDWCRTD